MVERIECTTAPRPGGHYSQAVAHGGLLFVSGQLPIDPETGERSKGPIEEQTRLVLRNLFAIVEAAGSHRDRILKTTVFVSDIEHWGRVNEVYQELFPDHRPARSVVPVPGLHYGFLVEIEAIAAL